MAPIRQISASARQVVLNAVKKQLPLLEKLQDATKRVFQTIKAHPYETGLAIAATCVVYNYEKLADIARSMSAPAAPVTDLTPNATLTSKVSPYLVPAFLAISVVANVILMTRTQFTKRTTPSPSPTLPTANIPPAPFLALQAPQGAPDAGILLSDPIPESDRLSASRLGATMDRLKTRVRGDAGSRLVGSSFLNEFKNWSGDEKDSGVFSDGSDFFGS